MSEPSFKASFIKENGFYLSTPQGNSMRPFIRGDKDLVMILPISEAPKKYDVILFCRDSGEHVLHRVIKTGENCCYVRGDNCYYTEVVLPRQWMGRLDKIYRNGKTDRDASKGLSYQIGIRFWVWSYPVRRLVHFFIRTIKKKLR